MNGERHAPATGHLLTRASAIAGGVAAACGALVRWRPAQAATTLDVAYAGSMGSLMEGPVKRAVAKRLGVEFHGRGQGANALANLIIGGSVRPDVFISVTPGPAERVLRAGKAAVATPVARTEMVIAYSPKSAFAPTLDGARRGEPGAAPWWRTLEQPGVRFGRTDPETDPQGRNVIFMMELASRFYGRPELTRRILGPTVNPQQIFPEAAVMERLQAGSLDASSAYKVQPAPFGLPYVTLPAEINLGDDRQSTRYRTVSLALGQKVYRPEPLVYYVAVLKDAPHRQEAAAFARWLLEAEAQDIFRSFAYDAPGHAASLHA
ncbi:MAG TPA: extracellular solute-binding protein [Candidatus Dormibacteraeota bacterium]|nr:extracellular solute-binding protein [Candidatus Dormibacteraeota bacterium]